MSFLKDFEIENYLMEESDVDSVDDIGPENDCEIDRLSIHSECPSEQDAEAEEAEESRRNKRMRFNNQEELEEESPDALVLDEDSENSVSAANQTNDLPVVRNRDNPKYIAKDGTKWSKEPVRRASRMTQENIIRDQPGVKSQYSDKKTPLECLELYIDEDILITICLHTNEKIRYNNLLGNKKDKSDVTTSETSIVELKALLGLLFLAGLIRSGRQNTLDLWNKDGTGVEIFPMTMSRNRFVFLLNNLRFDPLLSRAERSARDRLAPIREIFETFVENCNKIYSPTQNVTLDEELVAFRGRCGFRQYIPSKPAKYGIKIYSLVDSETFYTLNLEVYCGKQTENSPFEVSNKPLDVVKRMVRPISGSGINVTADNFFTSLEAATYLLEINKLTMVGTLRANKTFIPEKFKIKRPEHTSLFGFQKDVTIVSYVPKPRKMVYMLSTLHHDAKIDNETEEKQKPEIITYYNKTKSGVDVVDKLARTYDVSRNSKRWPLTIFFSILNHAGINAMVVYLLNNKLDKDKMNRKDFIRKLGLSLIEDHLRERKSNMRLEKPLRNRINEHLKDPSENEQTTARPAVQEPGKKVRCGFCPRNKDRKTKSLCAKCHEPICSDHCQSICNTCNN